MATPLPGSTCVYSEQEAGGGTPGQGTDPGLRGWGPAENFFYGHFPPQQGWVPDTTMLMDRPEGMVMYGLRRSRHLCLSAATPVRGIPI